MALRGAEPPGAHLPRDGEGEEGRGALLGPPTHRANIPLAQREGGAPARSRAPPLPLPLWSTEGGESMEELGKHHPRGPGAPEPGLGEGDVGRGLLFQVPKTEVTTPAPWGRGGGDRDRELGPGPRRAGPPPSQPADTVPQSLVFTSRRTIFNPPPTPPHAVPTSSLTFRGLRHGGTQAVHVVTPIAVVTKQQLVLGGETRPAGTLGARAPETGVGGLGQG